MKKVMLVFGTRPEAIKMCPLVLEMKTRKKFETLVCVTGQHREMLQQVLDVFGVSPDYDLCVMTDRQTLFDVTEKVLLGMKEILEHTKPDAVLVHGDTTTTFASALACFYLGIPVGHVEAGLRTYDVMSPGRRSSIVRRLIYSASYLLRGSVEGKPPQEGKKPEAPVTGNTEIDALKTTVRADYAP